MFSFQGLLQSQKRLQVLVNDNTAASKSLKWIGIVLIERLALELNVCLHFFGYSKTFVFGLITLKGNIGEVSFK